MQVRERLLILPIIGALDGQRVRQLTQHLLDTIRARRAKVVVMDVTGVPSGSRMVRMSLKSSRLPPAAAGDA